MATITNLEDVAADFLEAATITDAVQEGVSLATDSSGNTAFTSDTNDIDLAGTDVNHVALTGDADLDVTANDDGNLIIGNAGSNNIDAGGGDDQVTTGAGDDTVSLGDGNDTVEITGPGTKIIDGGAGDDTFIIDPSAAGSESTFTGLNRGDKIRLTIADSNEDGVLNFDDVSISSSDDGHLTFTLADGTSFTLGDVSEASALNGDINYEVVDNGDGTWDVVLS